ncbi:MAG: glycosyltransferase family 2 protein [Thaumarchaeota archaeon]|nr:glycosyltransferase family 2 protein [Nitrososphaerota archaeon]
MDVATRETERDTHEFRTGAASDRGFSVGICATGDIKNFEALFGIVTSSARASGLRLNKIIIVASACPPRLTARLRDLANRDNRFMIIAESARHGKAEAINKILENSQGEFVVFVNGDAVPEPGAIDKLLTTLRSDSCVGAVSAQPVFPAGRDSTSRLVELMWTTHNESSLELNHLNLSNHTSDELVAFRSSAVRRLPNGLVNDGAYLAGTARKLGYSVKFCAPARVQIQTPSRIIDTIRQRRRILFGHVQVWQKVGMAPKTIELLLVLAPRTGFRLFVKTIARHPRFLTLLPLAMVTETPAAILAIWDSLSSTTRHIVWRRYS